MEEWNIDVSYDDLKNLREVLRRDTSLMRTPIVVLKRGTQGKVFRVDPQKNLHPIAEKANADTLVFRVGDKISPENTKVEVSSSRVGTFVFLIHHDTNQVVYIGWVTA